MTLGPNNDDPNYIIRVDSVFGSIISVENIKCAKGEDIPALVLWYNVCHTSGIAGNHCSAYREKGSQYEKANSSYFDRLPFHFHVGFCTALAMAKKR